MRDGQRFKRVTVYETQVTSPSPALGSSSPSLSPKCHPRPVGNTPLGRPCFLGSLFLTAAWQVGGSLLPFAPPHALESAVSCWAHALLPNTSFQKHVRKQLALVPGEHLQGGLREACRPVVGGAVSPGIAWSEGPRSHRLSPAAGAACGTSVALVGGMWPVRPPRPSLQREPQAGTWPSGPCLGVPVGPTVLAQHCPRGASGRT